LYCSPEIGLNYAVSAQKADLEIGRMVLI